jgi:hypothetical protein
MASPLTVADNGLIEARDPVRHADAILLQGE